VAGHTEHPGPLERNIRAGQRLPGFREEFTRPVGGGERLVVVAEADLGTEMGSPILFAGAQLDASGKQKRRLASGRSGSNLATCQFPCR